MLKDFDEYWGVTIEFTARYRKPVPLDAEVRVIARITRDSSRIFEGTGEIILQDGTVAVEGRGKYMKLKLNETEGLDANDEEWQVIPSADDPSEVEL